MVQKYSLNDSIVLNTAVTGIYQQVNSRSDTTENLIKVVVQTSTAKYTGTHVILTVPLGVLQHSAIDFIPPLPLPLQNAISELGSDL